MLPAGRAPRGRSPTRCMSPNGATSERAAGRFAFGALPSGAASPWRTRAKLGARGPQRRFPGGLKRPRCVHLLLRAFRTLPLNRRDLVATGSADVRGGRGAEPAAGTRSRSPPASGPSEPSYPVYRRPLPRPCGSRTAAPAAAPRSARPSPRCFRGRSLDGAGGAAPRARIRPKIRVATLPESNPVWVHHVQVPHANFTSVPSRRNSCPVTVCPPALEILAGSMPYIVTDRI